MWELKRQWASFDVNNIPICDYVFVVGESSANLAPAINRLTITRLKSLVVTKFTKSVCQMNLCLRHSSAAQLSNCPTSHSVRLKVGSSFDRHCLHCDSSIQWLNSTQFIISWPHLDSVTPQIFSEKLPCLFLFFSLFGASCYAGLYVSWLHPL